MQIDRADAIGQHLHRESEHAGIARRFDDAVVRCKSTDHETLHAALAEEVFEERGVRLPTLRVAHAEPRIPVTSVGSLAHDLAFDAEVGMEGSTPRVVHAVDGPDPPVGGEVWRVLRMPILRVDDEGPSFQALAQLGVGDGWNLLSARHVQASTRIGEVVLDIDDQERCSFVVDRHRSSGGADATSAWEHRRVRRVRVIVSGHVQGVFFRTSCARAAAQRGVAGWVRNRGDGSVEAVFEGSTADVAALVAWCRSGPRGASVTDVDSFDESPIGERGFRITG